MCDIGVGDRGSVGFGKEAALDNNIVLLVDVNICVNEPTTTDIVDGVILSSTSRAMAYATVDVKDQSI